MKRIKNSAILALAAAALAFQSAHAAIVVSDGDLILGVEDINSVPAPVGNDLEVDLGSYSQFTTTSFDNFGTVVNPADLLGHGYNQFSVIGQTTTAVHTSADSTIGTINKSSVFLTQLNAPTITSLTANTLTTAHGAAQSIEADLALGMDAVTPGPLSPTGAFIPGTLPKSYSSQEGVTSAAFFATQPGAQSFGALNATLELYLFDTGPNGFVTPGSKVVDLGTFSFLSDPVTQNGLDLVFTGKNVPVTPEPSTYALMFLGMALLVWQAKRRTAKL
jgi:hypothetical protein